MSDRRPHFEIPPERVRTTPLKVRGGAKAISRPSYSAHGDFLRERAKAFREYAQEVEDAEATESLYLQVHTPASHPVRGERRRLRNAGLEVVSLSDFSPSSATVQVRKTDLPDFERKLKRYAKSPSNRGKSYLSIIDDIGPVPLAEKVSPDLVAADDNPRDCLLVFYAGLSQKERAAVLFAVRSFMARTGSVLEDQRRLSNGVTCVSARLRPSEALAIGEAFSTLRQITPNRVFFAPDSWQISPLPGDMQVLPPRVSTAVAVVDTGISASCPGIDDAVTEVHPKLPSGAVASSPDHGTFVASRVAYGDDLERSLHSGVLQPMCPLVDVPVLGVDARGSEVPPDELHLASAIDQVLPVLSGATRVVNISLGTNAPVTDGRVSLIAQVIDKHARDCDLLVVTTAGNIRDRRILEGFPAALLERSCRIDSPGDALLALTVGSIAKSTESGALSRPGELSAFSRRGPGPLGGVKPDLVAHGGNCRADGSTSARIATHGLLPGGQAWACDFGTSYAAPLVSAIGAQLFDHYPAATANLVRALLLHFTRPVMCPDLGIPPEHLAGLGEPDVDAARWAQASAAAFLHAGELTANRLHFLPFLVPRCLAEYGGGRLRIRATVVIDPPVDPDNQGEYARARVSLALRKPTEVGHAKIGVSNDVVPADKWCPLTQLDRIFRRSYETGEWELQMRLWTRNVPSDYRQGYATVIEVIDDSGMFPVRQEVEDESGTAYRIVTPRAVA